MSASRLGMMTGRVMEGVFAVNKPSGISSAQVVRDLQRHFNPSSLFAPYIQHEADLRSQENAMANRRRRHKKIQVKIGHGGTLDPLATGVLITGVGKGTKSLQDFLLCTKVYECIILFGTSTDTYDRVGKVLSRAPYAHVTKELVEEKMAQFRGRFDQLPPLFSALKMDGKPLYEYAREGKPIPREIQRRPVEVLELEMIEWMAPGTHSHKAPTEEADYAEINVANKLWKQEGVLPASNLENGKGSERDETDRRELFERKKRKLSADHDELVQDLPPSKIRRGSVEDATMSGGLAVGDESATKVVDETVVSGGLAVSDDVKPTGANGETADVKSTIEKSPTPSSPPTKAASPDPEDKGPPAARLRMVVTSGFYVRSLCHDLGSLVGSAGLMAELERTRQGDFEVGRNTLEYSELMSGESVWGPRVKTMINDWNVRGTSQEVVVSQGEVKEEAKEAAEDEAKEEAKENTEEVKEEVKEALKTENVEETSKPVEDDTTPKQ